MQNLEFLYNCTTFSVNRLDQIIQQAIPSLSRTRIQWLIKNGYVTIDDKIITKPSCSIKDSSLCKVVIPPAEEPAVTAQELPLKIIFEDDDLLVIDKPAGIVVHPAPGNWDHTLVNALLAYCKGSLSGIGGVKRPGIVHRLDKDTSGLMVIAKNDFTHHHLSQQFAINNRSLKRIYWAVVSGTPLPSTGTITNYIGRHSINRQKMAIVSENKGKIAITNYKLIKTWTKQNLSLLEFSLQTGRTHQIRLHCQNIKCPIVGDATYGGRKTLLKNLPTEFLKNFARQALHAKQLSFIHPVTLMPMAFTSDLPFDIANLINMLDEFERI